MYPSIHSHFAEFRVFPNQLAIEERRDIVSHHLQRQGVSEALSTYSFGCSSDLDRDKKIKELLDIPYVLIN
jgi:hypothetical protein